MKRVISAAACVGLAIAALTSAFGWAGPVIQLDPEVGPFAGGNTVVVTITDGSFGTITNVLVGGASVTPDSAGGTWCTFVVPPAAAAGAVDIVLQTSDVGVFTLAKAYRYNPAGSIGVEPDWSHWAEVASLPASRSAMSTAVMSNQLYAVSGFNKYGRCETNVYCYAGTNWTEVPSLPVGRAGAVVDELNGSLIVAGGALNNNVGVSTNVYRFTGRGWENAAALPKMFRDPAGATYAGALYVIGNHDGTNSTTDVYRYDGMTWTEVAGLPAPRHDMGVAVCGGYLYAVGGVEKKKYADTTCTNVYRYNGTSWTEVAGLPAPRAGSGVAARDGSLFVVGGTTQEAGGMMGGTRSVPHKNVYRYDGTAWTERAELPDIPKLAGYCWGRVQLANLDSGLYAYDNAVGATNVYRYPATVGSSGVEPASGSWIGGYEVVICGTNLCNGWLGDVTNVTLCGVAATVTGVFGSTQIVVNAGTALEPGIGDVRVFSTSYGETVKAQVFTYNGAGIAISGSAFGPVAPGAVVTNLFTVTNSGNEALVITAATTDGAGAAMFDVTGFDGLAVAPGTTSTVPVVFHASATGMFAPTCRVANNSPTTNYSFALTGSVFQLSANVGPYAGGNTITITNGHFGTITNVLVGGVGVTPVSSGDTWCTIVMPPAAAAGAVDIVVQTSDNGDITLAGAYRYNPAGKLGERVLDGFVWTNMAQGFDNTVFTVHVSADGELYAGGAFANAVGGASTPCIAKWGGAAWTNLGIGFNSIVREVREDSSGTLYAVGDFNGTYGGNQNCRRIGRWDGVNWTNMGQGGSSTGHTVTFDANDVPYFGGTFTMDGYGRNFGRIAKWNGGSWTNIYESALNDGVRPIGFNNTVRTSVRRSDGILYFGGDFTNAITPTGPVTLSRVAMWDGTELRPMGEGFNGPVYKLVVDAHGTLYAGGNFTASGGQSINRVARWDGVNWTNVGSGANNGIVYALGFDAQGNLYAGGSFSSPGNRLAMWDGATWHDAGGIGGINDSVWALACVSNETMVVGGWFTSAGGVATNRIGLVWPNRRMDGSGTTPSSGSWEGDYTVEIVGENLGNGHDITNVTLCGIQATIQSQRVDRVWVTAGAAPSAQVGDVVVYSTSFGTTTGPNAFEYLRQQQAPLVFTPASPQAYHTTNALAVSGGSGTGALSFAVLSGPGTLVDGTNLMVTASSGTIRIRATKAQDDLYFATSATGTVTATMAMAHVYLQDLAQIYNGTARNVTATSDPAGLNVALTYDGHAWAPTNAGSYAVAGTVIDANWQGFATGTLAVARAQDTIVFGATLQQYDGTGKAVTATADSGSPVAVTYNGSTTLPVNAGVYAVTGIVDAVNYVARSSTALTIDRADQVITNFLPANGAQFVLGASASLSAQSSSGLAVSFENLTPELASLVGSSITFIHPGVVQVRAVQTGDSNRNAAPSVVHTWRVGGVITNVAPAAANVGGGLEVTIQGIAIGDGANITNVTLCGVSANIVTQSVNDAIVLAGMAPSSGTGDVVVVSRTGGTMVLSNAFEYLWLDAPEQLDPVDVTASNLLARWVAVTNAESHYLDVGVDTNFMAYLPGFDGLNVAMAEQYPVGGLTEGSWYALRLFAWNTNGFSWPSRTVWVPATGNTPYETHPPQTGPVSQGAVMNHALTNMFHGAGLVYAAESSDTNVMTVAVEAGGRLVMTAVGPGTAVITVTATDPATGYTCAYSFIVQVVGAPALDADAFLQRELWNPRFTQALTVRNDAGVDAIGVRVLFADLMPGITVENQTGTSADGRPMIEMRTAFPNGSTLPLNIAYVCSGAYTVDEYPPTIELQYILPEWKAPLPEGGTMITDLFSLTGGRFVLQFNSVVGRTYAIEYKDGLVGGEWIEVPMRLRATANRTQWIDSGPPATQPPTLGLGRFYRVKMIAE